LLTVETPDLLEVILLQCNIQQGTSTEEKAKYGSVCEDRLSNKVYMTLN
jgi:hypothetical protein